MTRAPFMLGVACGVLFLILGAYADAVVKIETEKKVKNMWTRWTSGNTRVIAFDPEEGVVRWRKEKNNQWTELVHISDIEIFENGVAPAASFRGQPQYELWWNNSETGTSGKYRVTPKTCHDMNFEVFASEVAQALTKYQCTRPMVNMIHRAKSLEYNSDTESVSWVEGDSPVTFNISDIQEYKVDKENCCDKKLTTFDGKEYVFRLPEDFHSSADMNLSRTLATIALADYYAKMETATFPEPLTDELTQKITATPVFHFRNGQDLIEKASHQLTESIKHIHTLDQLKRDEPKIRKTLEQYNQLLGFQELAGDAIERCLATRPLQIQVGLEKNISGMLEHMGNYDTMNTQQHATGTKSFHAYLRNNETRVNGLCKGDVELFLDQHRNMGFEECW